MTVKHLAEEGCLPKLVGVLALTAVYWIPVRRWLAGGEPRLRSLRA